MRRLSVLTPLVFLCSCAPASRASGGEAHAAAARDCLDLSRVVGRRGHGPRAIVFETTGGEYRNDLPEVCPGLERPSTFTTLVFEPKSGPLCRNDFVRVADAGQLGALGISSGPRCRLGRFTPVPRASR